VKVFLDTNVLVSAFATRGLSADVLRLAMAEHELITGEVVLEELRRTLLQKFGVPERRVKEIEALLRKYPVEPKPATTSNIKIRDEQDAWVLASAIQAGADVLVTGDKDLLDLHSNVQDVQIVSPRGFWELVRRSNQ
jgi:uncharacterized protein